MALGISIGAAAGALSLVVSGCGKPSDGASQAQGVSIPEDQVMIPVNGVAGFGSQCPGGFQSPPNPVKLEFWGCALPLSSVDLAEPMNPLILSADCKLKTLTVRTFDRSIDTAWEMMPDNTFYFTVDGLTAKLKNDGLGTSDCEVPLSTDMWGKVDCADRDKAKIQVETAFWVNRPVSPQSTSPYAPTLPNSPTSPSSPIPHPSGSPRPLPSPAASVSPIPTIPPVRGTACRLPVNKCYFHALTQVNQCQ